MGGGYVLDFSNRTFHDFILETIGEDPYNNKYDRDGWSSSKANRLRLIFEIESNNRVGALLNALIEYKRTMPSYAATAEDHNDELVVADIAKNLLSEKVVEGIETIKGKVELKDFSLLAKSIREAIEQNQPQAALDRLHTYAFHFIRELLSKHKLEYEKEQTIDSLFGKYIKNLTTNGLIETKMTERILKSSISLLEAFNDIRNNKSMAHANQLLNYDESKLIASSVISNIHFIRSIEENFDRKAREEKRKQAELEKQSKNGGDDLPF